MTVRYFKYRVGKWEFLISMMWMLMAAMPVLAQSEAEDSTSLFLPLIVQHESQFAKMETAQPAAFTDSVVGPTVEKTEEEVVPVSVEELVNAFSNPVSVDIQLPRLDVERLLEEDRRSVSGKSARRIGIVRALPKMVSATAEQDTSSGWQVTQDGGRFWTLTIESPEAEAIRVHVENLQIPPGAHVLIYNTNNVKEVYGPYRDRDLFGTLDLWTESVFGSTVTVEYYAPPDVNIADVSGFQISEVAHVYVNPLAPVQASALSCHNDVSCHPSWATDANGVAYINIIINGGVTRCTGSLLNDFDGDTWIGYFLTANHCLSLSDSVLGEQAEANTIEFFWRYQTDSCNGMVPRLADVPRTGGGAELISRGTRYAGNDHAFLRIRNDLPGGLWFLGWDINTPESSEILTGIHHPVGEYKRISFGNYDGSSHSSYWRVEWTDGTVEGVSSGSPVFDEAHRVIGQLWGGEAQCPDTDTTDSHEYGFAHYGRYDQTYPSIQRWMEIGGTINVDSQYTGTQLGTPSQPFKSAVAAHNFAWNGSRIRFNAGSYPDAVTFTREVTLIAQGGMATIGQ